MGDLRWFFDDHHTLWSGKQSEYFPKRRQAGSERHQFHNGATLAEILYDGGGGDDTEPEREMW